METTLVVVSIAFAGAFVLHRIFATSRSAFGSTTRSPVDGCPGGCDCSSAGHCAVTPRPGALSNNQSAAENLK